MTFYKNDYFGQPGNKITKVVNLVCLAIKGYSILYKSGYFQSGNKMISEVIL